VRGRHDAVFVLGKELRRDRERALRELGARAAAAAIAHREGARRIISLEAPLQGQGEAGSQIVARMLAGLGVAAEVLHLEETTRSTREEALGLRRVLDEQGLRRALVLTSSYHISRSRRYFREVVGRDRVDVLPPEAFLARARPEERALILAGVPGPEVLADECKVEATFLALSRVLAPLPAPLRWEVEVLAGGVYRGIDGLRGSSVTGAKRGRETSG